jgi:4-carboxymuconolactone decarboxylase
MTSGPLRPPEVVPDRLTPEQRAVYDAIASGPRGEVPGPLRVWVLNPGLAERAQALGAYCRYGTALSPYLSELAILVTGAYWKAGFEWASHAPIAAKAGVPAAVIEAIRQGLTPDFGPEDEAAAAVHAFSVEMHATRDISDATYARALAALGATGVIDLVGILGYYTFISMSINAFRVPLPEGSADPFADVPQ